MFCTKCGTELDQRACFCSHCGTRTALAAEPLIPEPLMRSATDKKIAGVCGGFARYLAMDPTLVRLLWLLMSFGLPPAGILGYIAAWIIVPMEPVRIYTTAAPASGNTV